MSDDTKEPETLTEMHAAITQQIAELKAFKKASQSFKERREADKAIKPLTDWLKHHKRFLRANKAA